MANTNSYPNVTKAAARLATIGLTAIILLSMASCGMTTSIGAGEAGVRFSVFSGTDTEMIYGEGLKIHAPWVDVVRYSVRVLEQLEQMEALSSNGLSIGMDVSIRWRPDANRLPELHQTYGPAYFGSLVLPEFRSAVREVVGQFTPEELYSSKRTELQMQIFEQIRSAVESQYVQIEAVLIRDIRLPEQISIAIENKLKEEQEAERYVFSLEKERLEAERKQIEATGQAEYQRIITESLSPMFLRYKGIEATQLLSESPNTKMVIVGGGEDGLPLILGN